MKEALHDWLLSRASFALIMIMMNMLSMVNEMPVFTMGMVSTIAKRWSLKRTSLSLLLKAFTIAVNFHDTDTQHVFNDDNDE